MNRTVQIVLAQLAAASSLVACASQASDSDSDSTGDAITSDGQAGTTDADPAVDASDAAAGTATTPDLCSLDGEPTLEILHGEPPFEPLDAHAAELVAGVQGGFHILLGLRATHVDSSDLAVARITGVVEGEELAFSAPFLELACSEAGHLYPQDKR